MFAILLISVIQNTAELYRREPLPSAAHVNQGEPKTVAVVEANG
jgi:hypothetical protein